MILEKIVKKKICNIMFFLKFSNMVNRMEFGRKLTDLHLQNSDKV